MACTSAAIALQVLRRALEVFHVPNAKDYRTHGLRRDHALDLQLSGAPLWKTLNAWECRSSAFLSYLDMNKLEADVAVQAHLDESDGEHE